MKIQFLGGGLANQIRQYVFVRGQERLHPGEQWIYDDSYFFGSGVLHNGYELESVFGLKLNLLSNRLEKASFEKLVRWKEKGLSVPEILLETGNPIVLVSYYKENDRTFRGMERKSRQLQAPELPYTNIYYQEYWVEDRWFMEFKEENRAELTFPSLTESENQRYAEDIRNQMSVGIHVRRGDFVTIGWATPSECYYESCKSVLKQYPTAHFFVFSDDLEWCRENAKEMGFDLSPQTTYVEGNSAGRSYRDMQLMSMCRGIIRPALSSFSQVAAWLDRDLLFEVKVGKLYE